jgi:beta-glucosidase
MLWGVATAGHQVEGGSTDDWSIFESDPAIARKVTVNAAAGHVDMHPGPAGEALRHRDLNELARDLDRAAALGCTAYRFSVEWSRVEQQPGSFTTALRDYYVPAVRMMRERGLEPYVTLNHLTLPQWMLVPPRTTAEIRLGPLGTFVETYDSDPGFQASLMGWQNSTAPARFAGYVSRVVGALGPEGVRNWITLNEPVGSMVGAGYFASVWSPGFADFGRGKQVYFNLLRAHLAAYSAIKALDPAAQVGFAHNMIATTPLMANNGPGHDNVDATRRFDYFYNDHFLNSLNTGAFDFAISPVPAEQDIVQQGPTPWVRPFDFIGINYYYRARIYWNHIIGLRGGTFTGGVSDSDQAADGISHESTGLLTGLGWEIFPDGLRDLLLRVQTRYGAPIVVTEFGMSEPDESLRAPHLVAHARAIEEAAAGGADVRAAFYWTLADNFEWTFNYEPRARFGLFGVDRSPRAGGGPSLLTRAMTDGALALRSLSGGAASGSVAARFGALTGDGSGSVGPTASSHASYDLSVGGVRYLLLLARKGGGRRDLDALVFSFIEGRWASAAVVSWDPGQRHVVVSPNFDGAGGPRWGITLSADLQSAAGQVVGGPPITGGRLWWDGTYRSGDWYLRVRLVPSEQPAADPVVVARIRPPWSQGWVSVHGAQLAAGRLTGGIGTTTPFDCTLSAVAGTGEPAVSATVSTAVPIAGAVPAPIPVPTLARLADHVGECGAFDAVGAPPGAPVCVVGVDGSAVVALADDGGWISRQERGYWEPLLGGRTAGGGWVNAVSRRPGQVDFATVGTDGRAYTAARDVAGGWGGWWALPGLQTTPGAPITVASAGPDDLVVTAADAVGRTMATSWTPATGWSSWSQIQGGVTAAGGWISGVCRKPGQLDFVTVGTDGRAYTAARDVAGAWGGWWALPGLQTTPGAPITVASAGPDDLVVTAADAVGRTMATSWTPASGWSPWSQIQGGVTAAGGWISGVSRKPGQLDFVTVGTDGQAYTAARDDTGAWGGWWPLIGLRTRPGGCITIASPTVDQLVVAAVDGSGRPLSTSWSPAHPWAAWSRIGD